MGYAYDTITNVGVISYTNAVGNQYFETQSEKVDIRLCTGPLMTVFKSSKNLRSGDEGSNTKPISCVPGDTVEMEISSQNIGDTYAFYITLIDTFPLGVGNPSANSMSYVVGSETCDIDGSFVADSISWCTDTLHNTWTQWQTYDETARMSITNNCTGIKWKWNIILNNDENPVKSWIRVRYQWLRNNN